MQVVVRQMFDQQDFEEQASRTSHRRRSRAALGKSNQDQKLERFEL